jgi:predicted O-methyltransferase YrrM
MTSTDPLRSAMNVDLARALSADAPLLHVDRHGEPKHGGMNRQMGERFIQELSAMSGARIAETGSGVSTLIFLCLGASQVLSISPAPDLHERIRRAGEERGIDLGPLRFVDDRSETALPLLALVEGVELDAGFIDGNHGWPAVFVDFCYLNRMLRPGGLMFIDDVQIFAVAQLVCLLRQQTPHYELVAVEGKMATFRKGLGLDYLPDWRMEPFIVDNTATA